MEFHYAPGATPLDPDEASGLLPTHITTHADLNAWEQANIIQAGRWATRQKKRDLLTEGSRLMADLLAMRLGRPRLTWGGASASLTTTSALRAQYLNALRAADQGQLASLIAFARS